MALNFGNLGAGARPVAAEAQNERPQATIWLNIGMTVPIPNDQGEIVDTFVSLPFGLPIDTMNEKPITGSSADWHNLVQAKNFLLEQLKEAGASLQPGQEEMIEGLQIQLRKVGQPVAKAPGENPLLAAMAGKLKVAA
jgi:hypothetical protein